MGQTTLLVFLPNKQFLHMLNYLSFSNSLEFIRVFLVVTILVRDKNNGLGAFFHKQGFVSVVIKIKIM